MGERILKLTEVQRAYIAGLFDGDGSINSYRSKSASTKGNIRTEFSIGSAHKETLDTIKSWLGVGYLGPLKPGKLSKRQIFSLHICAQKPLLLVLSAIVDYSITKKRRIDLMIKYLQSRLSTPRIMKEYCKVGGVPYKVPIKPGYSEEELTWLEEIASLNFRKEKGKKE